jgi:hypothetical protein
MPMHSGPFCTFLFASRVHQADYTHGPLLFPHSRCLCALSCLCAVDESLSTLQFASRVRKISLGPTAKQRGAVAVKNMQVVSHVLS